MSTFNLNLLPSQAKFQAAKIKLQGKVKVTLMAMVVVWVVVVGTVLLINFLTKIRADLATTQYNKANQAYLAMSDDIVVSQRLKYKAKLVGGVLDQRFEYGKAFESVSKLFPPGIIVKNFDLKEQGLFLITAAATDKSSVDYLEKTVSTINGGQNDKFEAAKLQTLALSNGVWEFSLLVTMK